MFQTPNRSLVSGLNLHRQALRPRAPEQPQQRAGVLVPHEQPQPQPAEARP